MLTSQHQRERELAYIRSGEHLRAFYAIQRANGGVAPVRRLPWDVIKSSMRQSTPEESAQVFERFKELNAQTKRVEFKFDERSLAPIDPEVFGHLTELKVGDRVIQIPQALPLRITQPRTRDRARA